RARSIGIHESAARANASARNRPIPRPIFAASWQKFFATWKNWGFLLPSPAPVPSNFSTKKNGRNSSHLENPPSRGPTRNRPARTSCPPRPLRRPPTNQTPRPRAAGLEILSGGRIIRLLIPLVLSLVLAAPLSGSDDASPQ